MNCKEESGLDWMNTLEELCGQCAPSGFEGPAAQAAARLLEPLADEVGHTRLQSVVGVRRCGREGAKRLLLDAHLDEIGFLVTGVDDGFLRFRTIGGVDARMLPAREVLVLTQPPMLGVVATKPPHLQTDDEAEQALELKDLRVDVGLEQAEAEARIPVGTPMVYRESCARLAGGRVTGKSMDDRSCFAILVRTLELLRDQPLNLDLYVLGSSCEETKSAGATTGAYALCPDWCVAVDVTHGKTPDSSAEESFALGGGPVIGIGPMIHRPLSQLLHRTAEAEGIPTQIEVLAGRTGTNGDQFQAAREGIPTAVVSLPLRYMHTPVETGDLDDMEQTARLLAAFVLALGREEG